MKNIYYLNKAEHLKPALFHETVEVKGNGHLLNDGDEEIFDFGDHNVGYAAIYLESHGHHQDAPLYLQIQFAERKEELHQNAGDYHGWISPSWIQQEMVHVDVLPCCLKMERRYAFRYIRVKVLNSSSNYSCSIRKITADTVTSADDSKLPDFSFTGKDAVLSRISIRTLRNCMQEVFEDGPKRDRRLWLGDLRLEALANYVTFRNYDLVKRCLYLFAGSTLEEGRLANNVFIYPEVECDYQTMFDYTLFFIDTLYDYYEASGDLETLRDLEPVCLRQHELLRECFDADQLLNVEKAGNIFVDWNLQLDKQASGQAIYIYALKDLVRIEKILGRDTSDLEKEITVKSEAAMKLYDSERKLFVSGPDRQVSYMSQIWMVLAGVCDRETGREVLDMAEKDSEALKMVSPYAYHHYIQALINVGEMKRAYDRMHAYWGGMAEKGAATFWELYDPENPEGSPYGGIIVHSYCHAWSCTPVYFLRKYYAG